jgi:hypothetical protein
MVKPQSEPTVRHEALDTTFIGVEHALSTPAAPIHQFRGIRYASIPGRWRQSKLFTTYEPGTNATKYGYVPSRSDAIIAGISSFLQPNMPSDPIPLAPGGFVACNAARVGRVRVFEPQHHLPRQPPAHLPRASHGLGPWVSPKAALASIAHSLLTAVCSSGGKQGSGSAWIYDGGSIVQRSISLEKPVIVVTFKCVFLVALCSGRLLTRSPQLPSGCPRYCCQPVSARRKRRSR